jgi:hypothetical protein
MRRRGAVENAISDKKAKYGGDHFDGAGDGAARGHRGGVVGPKPEREAAALGTAESAASERASRNRGGAGDAADTCEPAGAAAGAAE